MIQLLFAQATLVFVGAGLPTIDCAELRYL